MKSNIYCLQDTHFTKDIENRVRCEWGFDAYFSSFSSNSRGVCILFNNNFEYKVTGQISDPNGNYLILDVKIDSKQIILCSVYGPNQDTPSFFSDLLAIIDSYNQENIIICGDFNLVLQTNMDYDNYLHVNNPNARKTLLQIIEERGLIDSFREIHPFEKKYTWRRRNPIKQARLDFFLLSENLNSCCNYCDIKIGYRSDHSTVRLKLKFDNFKSGKGLWKFNNSLLNDIEFVNAINNKIDEIKSMYSLPVYDRNQIPHIPNEDIQFTINDQLFLETLLMELRGKCISFSSYKKKIRDKTEANLKQEILNLEQNYTEENVIHTENLKTQLEEIRSEKLEGNIIRSRAKWTSEGEKPSNYFLNLESRNFTSKIIPKLETADGKIIENQENILTETMKFYSSLYKEKDTITDQNLNDILDKYNPPKLTQEESNKLEGKITLQETLNVLKAMKRNKSPGSDGFSSEFFKVFWKTLGPFIVRSLNYGYTTGELSITQKEGIIVCIPKENKPKQFKKLETNNTFKHCL